jgi:hypothetical protein
MDRTLKKMDTDLFFDGVQLSAFTRTVNGEEVKFLGGVASSTAKDFYGSVIDAAGQVKMLGKLQALSARLANKNSGLTAFLNHSYKIPEDTLGAFTGASLTTRTSDGIDGIAGGEQGMDFIDLDIECRVEESNPRAVAAWTQVKNGIRHGWSIGAYFLDAHWGSDDPADAEYDVLHVTDVELLEISLVGIPANQRAWCRSADDLKARVVANAQKIARDALTPEGRANIAPALLTNVREMVRRSIIDQDDEPKLERRALAVEFRRLAEEPSKEMTDEIKGELERAATLLTADDGGKTSPDDGRDLIMMSVSHMAKAVGHGLCVRSAGHIAKAIECLSEVGAADGGSVGPGGDENPNDMSAALAELRTASDAFSAKVTKLDPKAGVVLAGATELKNAIVEVLRVADTNSAAALIRANETPTDELVDPAGDDTLIDADATPESAEPDMETVLESVVLKLEPKAGDLVVIRSTTTEELDVQLAAKVLADNEQFKDILFLHLGTYDMVTIEEHGAEIIRAAEVKRDEAVSALDLAETELLSVRAEIESAKTEASELQAGALAKSEELAAATIANATIQAELITATAKVEAAKLELDETTKKIDAMKLERQGRVSASHATAFEKIANARTHADSEVKPEHYNQSAAQKQAALVRQASGNQPPPTGRDLAT